MSTNAPLRREIPASQLASRLNLGCGDDYRDGWTNVDFVGDVGPNFVVDLEHTPWPFPDDAFDHILASHVLEHLDDTAAALRECARVLAPDGTLEARWPLGSDARTDPTHVQCWEWRTPLFYDDGETPHWGPETGLELVDRRLHVWMIRPLELFTPLVRLGARHWPMEFWYELPGATGELIVEYTPR